MIIHAKLQSSRVHHQYGIFCGKSQTSFSRNATWAGSEEGRLFSQAKANTDLLHFSGRSFWESNMVGVFRVWVFETFSARSLWSRIAWYSCSWGYYKNIAWNKFPYSCCRILALGSLCWHALITLMLYYNSARNHKSKSWARVPTLRITQITMIRGQAKFISIEIFAPFQFPPVHMKTPEYYN